jgi:hypothetical protein
MAPGRGGSGFLKWYSLCNSLPDGYDLLHTLLFLIFVAMMLLANVRSPSPIRRGRTPQKICNYAACDRCAKKVVNNPVS